MIAQIAVALVAEPGVLQAGQTDRAEQLVDQPDPRVPDQRQSSVATSSGTTAGKTKRVRKT